MSADRLIRTFDSIGSTNEQALTMAAAGAPHGSIVMAAEQTAGRGRRGRTWHSPEGGLYLSYVVRGLDTMAKPALLTLAAGVAVASAILEATGLAVALKWPNDIVAADAPRKIAGILAEASGAGSRLEYAVIGIGINVSTMTFPPEVASRASSLAMELGRDVHRDVLSGAVMRALDRETARLQAGGHEALLKDWTGASPAARGREVSWRVQNDVRTGVTAGVDDEGALLVRTSTGMERLVAGEVTWA